MRSLAAAAAAAAAALVVASAALAGAGPGAATAPPCSGTPVEVFDNTNTGGVLDGGKPPSFDTKGKSYCLVSIVTYHWHGGHGAMPGTVGVTSATMSASATARGSAGQGGAPNVNWTGTFTNPKAVTLNGTYSCTDSDPKTWSQNPGSGGKGFCTVYGTLVSSGGPGGGKTTVEVKVDTKVGAVTINGGPAKGGKGGKGGKLSLKAAPDGGKPPLAVTFSVSAPKVVQWRLDYGDGSFRTGFGQPPATIAHTYQREGDFKPKLTTISSAKATAADSTSTSVSVHAAPLIALVPSPASGDPPLKVAFALSTTVQNISTWSVDFGDGSPHASGTGNPPAAVHHTYAKAGTYKPQFAVKPGQYALLYTVAQVTVGGGTPPVLNLTAEPTSGKHPLSVTFTLVTSIPAQLVSWEVIFGDGSRQTGQGAPPATVTHTYASKGTYAAYLVVAQQQQYGGVQYTAPRGGLAIRVG